MTEQAKVTFCPLGGIKAKKQINSIEDHAKQLVELNEFNKKDFNGDYTTWRTSKYLMNLLEKGLRNFIIKKKQLILIIRFTSAKLKKWVKKILLIIKIR